MNLQFGFNINKLNKICQVLACFVNTLLLKLICILNSPVYTFFKKAYIIELNADVETGNLKLGNASTSLYFFQFPISIFTAKIQDQQSVNYF
jgi:hypothetical protein